jgi:hypothetical protein
MSRKNWTPHPVLASSAMHRAQSWSDGNGCIAGVVSSATHQDEGQFGYAPMSVCLAKAFLEMLAAAAKLFRISGLVSWTIKISIQQRAYLRCSPSIDLIRIFGLHVTSADRRRSRRAYAS